MLAVGWAGLVASVPSHAQPIDALPMPLSLAEALAQANAQRSPLVVMVSLPRCPFCEVVRNSHLLPLVRARQASVVQVDMRSAQPIVDFDGARRTQGDLVRNWKIKVAPTVLFFGPGGVETAPRLEGSYIPDFYGYYLDERLRAARLALDGR
ncbi:MAG: hypothetical protein OHK0048_08950 [Rhodoferax sp.]